MENIQKISHWIEQNSVKIVDNIEQESVDVYSFLKKEFNTSNVTENHLFQFIFRSYYRIDNAGLTREFKSEYFRILEEFRDTKKEDFTSVLLRLHKYPNRKNQSTMQFSFVTKLFNTINDSIPIYDSEVARIFSLSRPHQKDYNLKLDIYLSHFKTIKNGYDEILKLDLIPKTLKGFNSKFCDNQISDIKKLDFIFWSAGKIKARYEK